MNPVLKIGDKVETINGVGTIEDIRQQGTVQSPLVYLIRVSGVCDIYTEDEFNPLSSEEK